MSQKTPRAVDVTMSGEIEKSDVGVITKQFLNRFAELAARDSKVRSGSRKQFGLGEVQGAISMAFQNCLDTVSVVYGTSECADVIVVINSNYEGLVH